MSKYIDDLIFDRTAEDLRLLTDKAYIDYNDLNRVESAVKWVSYVLNRYGYRNATKNKTDWAMNEWRSESDMVRLRDNINAIRGAFFTLESTPTTPDRITYISIYQANAIEKIIYDIGTIVENMAPGQPHLAFRLGTKVIGNRSVSI